VRFYLLAERELRLALGRPLVQRKVMAPVRLMVMARLMAMVSLMVLAMASGLLLELVRAFAVAAAMVAAQ
jgi:hypothetical protein